MSGNSLALPPNDRPLSPSTSLERTQQQSIITRRYLLNQKIYPYLKAISGYPLFTLTTPFVHYISQPAYEMLRRKPTALTITSEDIAAFEEAHARHLAFSKYQKTGEDPNGWFTGGDVQEMREENNVNMATDPNDELKPLPGDKARIVRTREERIIGGGAVGVARR